MQSTVGNSVRSSGATAYLTPSLDRPNLDLLVQTQAIKLVQANKSSAFTGVQVAKGASGMHINLYPLSTITEAIILFRYPYYAFREQRR